MTPCARPAARRLVLVLAAAAVLASAPASAAVRRGPPTRVRPVLAPARVEVVVRLPAPPLARWRGAPRRLAGSAAARRLEPTAFASRLYLDRLVRAQAVLAARIHAALPNAAVRFRLRTVLDALAVSLPIREVPRLTRLAGVAQVYPSERYHALTNTVPGLVDATAVWGRALAGAGDGVKIGVIDDGIDQRNPFFRPRGMRPPPGFPRGVRGYTTGKVIVARAFPPPGGRPSSRLPFDPRVSEHGTHVAGIAAGDAGTTADPGGDLPVVRGLSGVAPRAYLGNYRALAVADPRYGSVGGTAEIAAAVDRAVADGMDVLNLSLGGTEGEPGSDALVEAVQNAVHAGVVVVAAAGNDYGELSDGSIDSPGTAPDAITVAATTTSRFFGVRASVTGPGPVPSLLQRFGAAPSASPRIPRALGRGHPVIDVAGVAPHDSRLCRPLTTGKLRGRVVLVDRGICDFTVKAANARRAGALGIILRDVGPGDPFLIDETVRLPTLVVSRSVGTALRSFIASTGGRAEIRVGRRVDQVPGTPRVVASFSSGGPTPFTQVLKPDLAAPGESILSAVPAVSIDYPGPFAVFDGTSMSSPAVAGAAALLLQAHPGWTPQDVKSALMAAAVPAWRDDAAVAEASPLREGAGFVDVAAADDPGVLPQPASIGFGLVDGRRGAQPVVPVTLRDAGDGAGPWSIAVAPQPGAPAGVAVSAPAAVDVPPGGVAAIPVTLTVPPGAAEGDVAGAVILSQGARTRRIVYWAHVERPALPRLRVRALAHAGTYVGDTRRGTARVAVYRYPQNAHGSDLPGHWRGREQIFRFRLDAPAVNAGVTVESLHGSHVLPLLLRGRDENRVAGASGLPLDVGPLTFTSGQPTRAAGLWWPRTGDYYVAVDSAGPHTAGRYRLRFWINDLRPPTVRLLRREVRAGAHARLTFRIRDAGSGVDPGSLVAFVGSYPLDVAYDARTGTAMVNVGLLPVGRYRVDVLAGDEAQSKDVLAFEPSASNTALKRFAFRVVRPLRRRPA